MAIEAQAPAAEAGPSKDLAAFYAKLEAEVANGLPNEARQREQAQHQADYYRMDGHKLIERRPAETEEDFDQRAKRSLPFTPRVVDLLAKLYDVPPSRSIEDDETATKRLGEIYDLCSADLLMQQADAMAILHGVAAIQVAPSGDPDDPIAMHLWSGRAELAVYEAPGRANQVAACVTIDCRDNQTFYTLWTPYTFKTWKTAKWSSDMTSGGRVGTFVPELSGTNPYRVLPFMFFWFNLPTSGIDCQKGLGAFLSNFNSSIDVELSDMAQAVSAYHRPIPIAYDCADDFNPVLRPGKFTRCNRPPSDLENPPPPRLEYLQADLDIEGGWENLRSAIESTLDVLGIPLTAYRLESRELPSGEALLAEQKPLKDKAARRRPLARRAERDLARVVLAVHEAWYGRIGTVDPAKAIVILEWPAPSLDLPSVDRDREDKTGLELGIESRVTICMRRYGLNRKQALDRLKQIADDEREAAAFLPKPPADEAEGDQADDEDQTDDQVDDESDPWKVEDDDDATGDKP